MMQSLGGVKNSKGPPRSDSSANAGRRDEAAACEQDSKKWDEAGRATKQAGGQPAAGSDEANVARRVVQCFSDSQPGITATGFKGEVKTAAVGGGLAVQVKERRRPQPTSACSKRCLQ